MKDKHIVKFLKRTIVDDFKSILYKRYKEYWYSQEERHLKSYKLPGRVDCYLRYCGDKYYPCPSVYFEIESTTEWQKPQLEKNIKKIIHDAEKKGLCGFLVHIFLPLYEGGISHAIKIGKREELPHFKYVPLIIKIDGDAWDIYSSMKHRKCYNAIKKNLINELLSIFKKELKKYKA